MTSLYYVRVTQSDSTYFEKHLSVNGADFNKMSVDYDGTALYGVRMTSEQELSLKLSFPLRGCLNFKNYLD